MVEEDLILSSWVEQEKKFTDNLTISRKRPTKDSVHDLRVAVKKMRSYLRLKEQLTGEEWKEAFLKISLLFKLFGRLRDFDISLFLTRKFERAEHSSFSYFKEYLSVNRSLSRKWVKIAAINFNEGEPGKFKPQFQPGFTNEELCEKIIHASAIKIKKAKNLSKHFNKNAHEIRKQLKDVYYWLKICPIELADSFIELKTLDRILNYLGSWQNHFMLRKKIKEYIKDFPKRDEEKSMLKTLERKLETAQEEILDKAEKKWKEIENKKATVINRPLTLIAPDPIESGY